MTDNETHTDRHRAEDSETGREQHMTNRAEGRGVKVAECDKKTPMIEK